MKSICVVIGSRANYSSIKSALTAIANHHDLTLQLVVTASAVLDRYGDVSSLIKRDGFDILSSVHSVVEGETPYTMAMSTGLGLVNLATCFNNIKPDIVLTIGDRFETMATTLAAAYMNIPIAHTMGGEVSGTIDESIRHAITKFAHIHFPASIDAYNRIIRLGEKATSVFLVGCPRIDLVHDILQAPLSTPVLEMLFDEGVGNKFDLDAPFLVVSQHPVTTEYGLGEQQITYTLQATLDTGLPAIVLWPNSDAGSDDIARGIRKFREVHSAAPFYYLKNLPIHIYVNLLKRTACLVGNSSSGIREGAFIGTPVVNIGTRQSNRERGKNVIDSISHYSSIFGAIKEQIRTDCYPSDPIYGDGTAGLKIADVLSTYEPELQKCITY